MNTHLWYKLGAKSTNLVMPYINWKDFNTRISTIDNLPILIDFGDGYIQSVPGNNTTFLYSKASTSQGEVTIFNANRLLRLNFEGVGNVIYRTNFVFSLAIFRVATNLISFNFGSGNIFGDAGNLSPNLRTFQLLQFCNGITTNLEPLPSLFSFNQQGTESNFDFVGNQVVTEMPNLQSFTIAGKSKVEMSLADLPQYLLTIEISNTNPFTAINRRNRITYAPFTVGVQSPGFNVVNMLRFVIDCEDGFGFNQVELDAILNYLASLTWNATLQKVIRLSLGHGNRSQFSDDAVDTLSALTNISISLNPKIII